MGIKDERAERLAAQLRENLRRRKAQARGVGGSAGGASGSGDDPDGGAGGVIGDPGTRGE